MRTTYLIIFCLILLAAVLPVQAQDDAPPVIAITTVHWNWDYEEGNEEDWEAIEKEYFEKVTMKNEHILAANFFVHYFSPDNTEALAITVYKDWESMATANDRTSELVQEGWPDEAERDAYFEKRNAYYDNFHSDEIYVGLPGTKSVPNWNEKPLVALMQVRENAFYQKGSNDEYNELSAAYAEAVYHKNDALLGYYTMAHLWGADSRNIVDFFIYESLGDIEASFEKNATLAAEAWPVEEERNAFMEKLNKYTTGKHGDYIYRNVPGFAKRSNPAASEDE